jgi:hypothetical protein
LGHQAPTSPAERADDEEPAGERPALVHAAGIARPSLKRAVGFKCVPDLPAPMLTDWLNKSRLKRTERKLRRLRSRQRQIRDKEEDLQKVIRRGAANDEQKARAKKLHDEKEHLTQEINRLHADEERLKAELKAAGIATH